MSVSAARVSAEQLRVALLDHGVRQVSIELQPGVGPKADPWGPAGFVRGMGHHIASRPSQGLTPGLGLVKAGRRGASPLQGPLCNGYGGYDLVARIVTMGWANHPGAGGPWSVPGWGMVPRDNGRPYIFGWEFEGGFEPYTDQMHDFMARCGAGTLDWLGVLHDRGSAPLECWGEHKDPWAPDRKIDRLGYTAASGRQRIAAVRGAAPMQDRLQGDPDMRALRTPDGTIWLVTPTEVTATGSSGLAGSVARAYQGGQYIAVTREEVQELAADASARRARLVLEVAKAAGGDVDEEAIVAKLTPAIAEAVAGKTGATRDEIADLLRGITLRAS